MKAAQLYYMHGVNTSTSGPFTVPVWPMGRKMANVCYRSFIRLIVIMLETYLWMYFKVYLQIQHLFV